MLKANVYYYFSFTKYQVHYMYNMSLFSTQEANINSTFPFNSSWGLKGN
jgi:hypothetical protein